MNISIDNKLWFKYPLNFDLQCLQIKESSNGFELVEL